MNLQALSPLAFTLGLAALAAGLFALQRLRVRHREQVVVTTLFWREEVQEQRARTLVERFRHPLTYALCLLLAGLLWTAFAAPDADRAEGERHVILLDGAVRADGPRFEAARAALAREVARRPRDRTEVLVCGASLRRVLGPGEDRALLGPRLDALGPGAAGPETITRALRAPRGDGPLEFVVVGDARPDAASVAALPADVTVTIAGLPDAAPPAPAAAVRTLGLAPAASGDWSRADALVELSDGGLGVAASVDGVPLEVQRDGPRGWVRGIPLEGGVLEVVPVARDGSAAADASVGARIALPDRPPIRVSVTSDAPGAAAILAVLDADPAVVVVPGGDAADVVVGDVPAGAAGLALSGAASQEEAILITHGRDVDAAAALERALGELGLDRVDGAALAERVGRTIAVGAAPGDARRVSLWSELLDDDLGFVESRAFPLVVARAVRWIADAPEIPPYAATGAPVPSRLDGAPPVEAALPPADASGALDVSGAARAADLRAASFDAPGPWRPLTWVLLAAVLLMVAEWVLHRTGRIA